MEFYDGREDKQREIPEVGEFWCHKGDRDVYLRLPDDCGKAIGGIDPSYMYSLCLSDHMVMRTPKDDDSLIVLDYELTIKGGK